MKNIKWLFLFVLLTGHFVVFGQGFSNKGTDFWIPYPVHVNGASSVMGLYITSDVNATGTIAIGTQTLSFSVTANNSTQKFIGPSTCTTCDASNASVYLSQTDGIATGAAIHVVSDKPVVVYSHIIFAARSGATLVLPSTVWGKQYIVPSYSCYPNGNQGYTGYGTITVLASEANTLVKITPSIATLSGKPAGTSYTVTLANPGDVYQVQFKQNADISGTLVESQSNGSGCKKIAVYSSTTWSAFGCTPSGSGDNLFQQLFPVGSWGKNFLTAPSKTRIFDIIRVFVADPTTKVTKTENGVTTTLTGLLSNSFYEYNTGNPTFIQADKPASVVQYFTTSSCQNNSNIGDPEMIVLNPVEQTINNITVFSAHQNSVPKGQSNVVNCYLNIILKTNATSSFKINNASPASSFIAIPGTAYSYLQENVTSISSSNPVQNLKADSSFIAIAYGFGDVESYGYNAGTNVKDFTQVASFQNPFKRIDSAVTCVNAPFEFAVPLNFQPLSIKWDFTGAPNISPSATVTPAPTYDSLNQNTGLYYYSPHNVYTFSKANTVALRDTVKLYTTSSTPDGCGSTEQIYTIPVKVNEQPISKFVYATNGCVTDSVMITDQSTNPDGSLSKWLWDFGDNSTDGRFDANTFGKKYAAGGSYTIKLKVVSDIGCLSEEVSQTVQISDKPIAKFASQAITCADNDISFTDASTTSSGTIVKWTWNLDDGAAAFTNATNAATKTKYPLWGTKSPKLLVETATGCKSDTFTLANFKVNPLPVVNFGIPEVCLSDANAPFTDSTKIAEGFIVSYLWNFNAGSPAVSPGPTTTSSTAQNPQVKYNKSDNYLVSLTATSAASCVAFTTLAFTVNGTIPKAVFDFANTAPYCGTRAVQLRNNSTVDFGNVTKLEIYWDYLNDPATKETIDVPVSGKIYLHSYPDPASPKQYTIRMVAYSGGTACSDFTSRTITLFPLPRAAFTASTAQLCYGDMVNFTDKSNGKSSAAVSWQWDLGNGVSSTLQNPSHQYNDSGFVDVSLYFTNADGCLSDTAMKTLAIYPNPKLTLKHNELVLSGGTITITPQYVYGSQLQYLWTPATYLSSDTSVAPKCTPSDDITYKLTLTAQGGCSVSDTVFVKVLKGPEVPNVFTPNGDGINDTWKIRYLESYADATVEVYNRAGQIVYRSLGYSVEWDGNYKGSPLPVGTYYYIINPKNGRPIVTGSVTILK
ncbi:MAG: PKD domain-containing protein [Bacteroidota bacterium]